MAGRIAPTGPFLRREVHDIQGNWAEAYAPEVDIRELLPRGLGAIREVRPGPEARLD